MGRWEYLQYLDHKYLQNGLGNVLTGRCLFTNMEYLPHTKYSADAVSKTYCARRGFISSGPGQGGPSLDRWLNLRLY